MQKQQVSFEEVYDVFAVRIVIDTDRDREKSEIWRTYSVVTDTYHPTLIGSRTGSAYRKQTVTAYTLP